MNSAVLIHFLDVVAPVHAGGWSPLPLYAPGALDYEGQPHHGAGKAPLLSQWQALCVRRLDLDQLRNSVLVRQDVGGLGIACGFGGVFGVDVDVDDEALADRVHGLAARVIGTEPLVRYGRRPRRMLVFRTSDGSALHSSSTAFANGHKVELIGAGKQLVAFGIHPKTGLPYEWQEGRSPATVAVDDVQAVEPWQVEEFFAQLPDVLGPVVTRTRERSEEHRRQWTAPEAGSSREITATVNGAAFSNLDSWVHGLGLNHLRRHGKGFTAQATFRAGENETSLKITTAFVYDHGERESYSPVGLVKRALDVGFLDALRWLDERVGDGTAVDSYLSRRRSESTTAPEEDDPFVITPPAPRQPSEHPVGFVRHKLELALRRSVATADQFLDYPGKAYPPRLGIRAREGIGKSSRLRSILLDTPKPNTVTIVAVPTLALAHEAAGRMNAEAGRTVAEVVIGRTGADALGNAVCDHHEAAAKIRKAGGSGGQLCRSTGPNGAPVECPSYPRCAHQSQAARISQNKDLLAVFVAMPVITAEFPVIKRVLDARNMRVRLLVIDESFVNALVSTRSIASADLHQRVTVAGYVDRDSGDYVNRETATADLHKLMAGVASVAGDTAEAIARRSQGYRTAEPIALSDLRRAGLNAHAALKGQKAARQLVATQEWKVGSGCGDTSESALADLARATAMQDVADAVVAAFEADHEHVTGLMSNVDTQGRHVLAVSVRQDLSQIAASAPLLFLDAGLLPEPQMRALFAGYREIFDELVADGPGATRLHIGGETASKRSLSGDTSTRTRIKSALRFLDVLVGSEHSVVTSFKSATKHLAPADFHELTFGSVRGVDVHNGADVVAVVGTTTPGPRDMEALASVLFQRPVDRVESWYDTESTSVAGIDGRACTLSTARHPDPGVEALLRATASEARQAAARGRPADVGPDGRQLIVTVGDGALGDMKPDAVVSLQSLQLGRFEAGLDLGILAENPAIMGRIAGWSEGEIVDAKGHGCEALRLIKAAVGSLNGLPQDSYLRESVETAPGRSDWFAVMVQRAGARQRTTRAWVKATTPEEAAARIRAALPDLVRADPVPGLTLRAVAEQLFRSQVDTTDWEADQRATYELPAIEPFAIRTEREKVEPDHTAGFQATGLDVALMEELRREERIGYELWCVGLDSADVIPLFALKHAEPDTWDAIPMQVRDAVELAVAA